MRFNSHGIKSASFLIALFFAAGFFLFSFAQPEARALPTKIVLRKIMTQDKNNTIGQIHQCTLNNKTLYTVSPNIYDGIGAFYDALGDIYQMSCGGDIAGLPPNTECRRIKDCRLVYASEKNIFGIAPTDPYGIKKP